MMWCAVALSFLAVAAAPASSLPGRRLSFATPLLERRGFRLDGGARVSVSTAEELVAACRDRSISHIELSASTYFLDKQLRISRDLVLQAAQPGTVVLDGQGSTRVLSIRTGRIQLIGLNITRGSTRTGAGPLGGGGILVSGKSTVVIVTDCNIYGCEAPRFLTANPGDGKLDGFGGGVAVLSGTVSFTRCHIYSNDAQTWGGGVFIEDGSVTLTSCDIHSNTGFFGGQGGGVEITGGTVDFLDCDIYQNDASCDHLLKICYNGGGIEVRGGTVSLSNCNIYGNTASNSGAGILISSGGATVTFTDCDIYGNSAGYHEYAQSGSGGGIQIRDGDVTFNACGIYDNKASSSDPAGVGGGIDVLGGTVKLNGCNIYENEASSGANMHVAAESLVCLFETDLMVGTTAGQTSSACPPSALDKSDRRLLFSAALGA